MSIEDYILNGDCEGCDQDPTFCLHRNSCSYESKFHSYNFYPGQEIFYATKAENQENILHIIVVRRVIDSLKEINSEGKCIYWLKDMWGGAAGSAPENALFFTKQEAVEYAISKIF